MQKVLLLIVSVITFKSSDIISGFFIRQAQEMEEQQRRVERDKLGIVEELAKKELGSRVTWWDLTAKMRETKIWEAAATEYARRKNAEKYR